MGTMVWENKRDKKTAREWEMKGNRVRWEGIKEVDRIRK